MFSRHKSSRPEPVFYQLVINVLSTCYHVYQLVINCFINFLSTVYQLFINFLSTVHQLFINILSTFDQLFINLRVHLHVHFLIPG